MSCGCPCEEMRVFQILEDTINSRQFSSKSDEERFKIVLKILHNCCGFDYWMSNLRSAASKEARKSEELRELGNEQYSKKTEQYSMSQAIQTFTKSLAYAPIDSTEMSLAYGNRSAVLMNAQLYDDALLDINRAFKLGYPERLKAKLFMRRAMCLMALNQRANQAEIDKALENARRWVKKMHRDDSSRKMVTDILNDPKTMKKLPEQRKRWKPEEFSTDVFEKNREIIGASSSLAFKSMNDDGSHVFATKNIKVGEIVSIQEPYAACVFEGRRYTNCGHCFTQTWSGIPCNHCVYTIYCSERCRDDAWDEYHSFECQIPPLHLITQLWTRPYTIPEKIPHLKMIIPEQDYNMFDPVVMKSFIKAVKEAGGVEGLMRVVEKIEGRRGVEKTGFTGDKFDGSKFVSLYTLPTYAKKLSCHDMIEAAYRSCLMTFLLARKSKLFGEELSLKSFYEHKWVPFVGRILMRLHLVARLTVENEFDTPDSFLQLTRSVAEVPFHGRIAHSCVPNVASCCLGKNVILYALYPIKKDGELFVCRGNSFEKGDKKYRKENFPELYPCECEACLKNWAGPSLPSRLDAKLPIHVIKSYIDLMTNGEKYMSAAIKGNIFMLAKLINDLSETIRGLYAFVEPPCDELRNLLLMLNRTNLIMGNHQDFF